MDPQHRYVRCYWTTPPRRAGVGLASLLLARFAEMEYPSLPLNTQRTPASSRSRRSRGGRPIAHSADKIECAPLVHGGGQRLGQIVTQTAIARRSLHRYLTDVDRIAWSGGH